MTMTTELLKPWMIVQSLTVEALEVATVKGVGTVEMRAVARAGETILTGATEWPLIKGAARAENAASVGTEAGAEAWIEREAWIVNTNNPEAEGGALIDTIPMTMGMMEAGVYQEIMTGDLVLTLSVGGKPRVVAEIG